MKNLEVVNPYNLEKIGELPYSSEEQVEKMLSRGHAIAESPDKWLPKTERIRILENLKSAIIKNRSHLVKQALSEGGKPLKDTEVEIDRGVSGIDVAIEGIRTQTGREVSMNISASSANRMAYTYYRPRGLVVGISAFNHPFNLIIHQAIPAIAAGSPIVIKPASTTPLSCKSVLDMLYECGLPKDYAQLAIVTNDLAEKMVRDPRQRFLTFIGSARVGWSLRSKMPPGAECALEHGGVAPVIVDKSANLSEVIPSLVKGGYYHAGQVCVSVQRIYVHADIKTKFMDEFVSAVKKLKVGDPADAATEVGPLIVPKEVDRVHSWVEEAIQKKAKLHCGGEKLGETTYAPSVLENVPMDCHLGSEEVFGPVTTVEAFTNLDEAIQKANALPVAFQASIFTENLQVALRASRRLEGLTVMVNDHTAFRVDWMPFGGYKNSGSGVGGILDTIHHMSIEKMVVMRSPELSL